MNEHDPCTIGSRRACRAPAGVRMRKVYTPYAFSNNNTPRKYAALRGFHARRSAAFFFCDLDHHHPWKGITPIMATTNLPMHAHPAEIAYDHDGNPCSMSERTQAQIVAEVTHHNGYSPTITHASACGIEVEYQFASHATGRLIILPTSQPQIYRLNFQCRSNASYDVTRLHQVHLDDIAGTVYDMLAAAAAYTAVSAQPA